MVVINIVVCMFHSVWQHCFKLPLNTIITCVSDYDLKHVFALISFCQQSCFHLSSNLCSLLFRYVWLQNYQLLLHSLSRNICQLLFPSVCHSYCQSSLVTPASRPCPGPCVTALIAPVVDVAQVMVPPVYHSLRVSEGCWCSTVSVLYHSIFYFLLSNVSCEEIYILCKNVGNSMLLDNGMFSW